MYDHIYVSFFSCPDDLNTPSVVAPDAVGGSFFFVVFFSFSFSSFSFFSEGVSLSSSAPPALTVIVTAAARQAAIQSAAAFLFSAAVVVGTTGSTRLLPGSTKPYSETGVVAVGGVGADLELDAVGGRGVVDPSKT